MSVPKSNEEWKSLITHTISSLPSPINTSLYATPQASGIPQTIDHTQLSLSVTESQIDDLCAEAREHIFATVCVRLNHVSRAVAKLRDTPVGVACVVGFHEGTYPTDQKVSEAREAINQGASELDMVINYPLLKAEKYTDVYEDILAVRKASFNGSNNNTLLKVILETSQLSQDEIVAGSVISCLAGADYVKTSTGFNGPGANVNDVASMKASCVAVKQIVKVKASGGVRSVQDCVNMIRAGADRIGASAGVKIAKAVNAGTDGVGDGNDSKDTY